MIYRLRAYFSCFVVVVIMVATGCATAPDSQEQVQEQEQEQGTVAALDEAWTAPLKQVCHSTGWDDYAESHGPPVTDSPSLWTLVHVSDQMPNNPEIAAWYDELCDGGDGAACTLRALLEFFPAEAEGTRDGDPNASAAGLNRACNELEFGPACHLQVEYVRNHATSQQLDGRNIEDMVFQLLGAGCMFGDASSCYTMGDTLDSYQAGSSDRSLRDYILARGCQQGHRDSCFRLGWTVLQERDDLLCSLASMRAGCQLGSHRACTQVEEVTGQICSQSGEQAPVFCDDVDDVIPDGSSRPLLAWHDRWIQRCNDGELFACHVAGRALFTDKDGYFDVLASSDQLARTCSEGHLFDCGVAAGAWTALYRVSEDDRVLKGAFQFAEQGCVGGDRVACGMAVNLLFAWPLATSDILELEVSTQRRIAGNACEMGIGRGCSALIEHFVSEMDDDELRENIERFGDRCTQESSRMVITCMAAVVSLDRLEQHQDEDREQRRKYLDIACKQGVDTACIEEGDGRESALEDLVLSGNVTGDRAERPGPYTDCADAVDQPLEIECREQGGQRLGSDEWRSRYGCGVTEVAELETSPQQPVEVCRLRGQLEFLSRLSCADGSTPFSGLEHAHEARVGNVGEGGRCGEFIDLYEVPCPEATYEVYIDMYFCPE